MIQEINLIKNNKNNGYMNKWMKRNVDKNKKKQKKWHMHNKHQKLIDLEECYKITLHLEKLIWVQLQNKQIYNQYIIISIINRQKKRKIKKKEKNKKNQQQKELKEIYYLNGVVNNHIMDDY